MAKNISKALSSTIQQADKAYESADKKWFDFLSDDLIVYNNSSSEPFKGKKAYQKFFEKSLTSGKRKLSILSRLTQELGESAIVSQSIQITQDGIIANVKQSVVWISTLEGWKIKHLHSALVGTPQPTKSANKLTAITVLNEKIASVASVVGVAQ